MVSTTTTNVTQFRVSKQSGLTTNGSGTTHKIREQLNFKDDRKWKKFSSRRLELIDKFGLSSKKASEQDENIKQIATILRTEFNYPISYGPSFEKLVTAAVQSVRRNRKRSKKNLLTPNNSKIFSMMETSSNPSDDDISHPLNVTGSSSRMMSPVSTPSLTPSLTPSVTPISSSINPPLPNPSKPFQLPSIQPKTNNSMAEQKLPKLDSSTLPQHNRSNNSGEANITHNHTIEHKSFNNSIAQANKLQHPYNDIIKGIISDLANNVIPLSEQSQKDSINNPKLSDFALSTQDHHLLSLDLYKQSTITNNNDNNADIPYFLREKLLLHIQRSRTCSELAIAQGSVDMYPNLEILGEMSLKSSIAFVIERFFSNLLPSAMEYVTSKTMSQESLSLLSVKLFDYATIHNMQKLPAANVHLKILYLLLGGIVKDFGFDPVLYPLSEIIYQLVMKQYPLVLNTPGNDPSFANGPISQRTAILSTTSMKPQVANQDVNRKVTIKFQDRQQVFSFPLLSNGTPSISEILENCKSLFNIIQPVEMLGVYHFNSLIVEDNDLVKLFNSFITNDNILLEVKEKDSTSLSSINHNSLNDSNSSTNTSIRTESPIETPFDGLTMLSAVSLQIKDESNAQSIHKSQGKYTIPTVVNRKIQHSDSVSKLDNIIRKMSNSPVIAPSNTKSVNKGSFQNGTLPQPFFQPLL